MIKETYCSFEVAKLLKEKGKICTLIEQSKKLIEMGIGVNTADMYYDCNSYGIQDKPEVAVGTARSKDIPAWSLTALIELLPNKILVNNDKYFLHFTKNKVEYIGIVTWDGQKKHISRDRQLT